MTLSALRRRLSGQLPMPLTHVVPVEHRETAAVVRRRQQVVAGVSVVGAGLLGLSLSTRPGSKGFYATTLSVAAVWTAGGLLSGPLHLGWIQRRDQQLRRPLVTPVATGVGAFGFFYACALVAKRIPLLDNAISRVLVFAEEGNDPARAAHHAGQRPRRGGLLPRRDVRRPRRPAPGGLLHRDLRALDDHHPQPRAGPGRRA